jgi:3-oxoacyl-[acyl-carrier protein] reductase
MNKTPPTLAGKAAVVTGGSRGIGMAIAEALAAAGASVAITGRDQLHLDRAVERLAVHGPHVVGTQADVRIAEDAARAIDGAAQTFGGLDILINNAGVGLSQRWRRCPSNSGAK